MNMKAKRVMVSIVPELIQTSLVTVVVLALAGACGGVSSSGNTGGVVASAGTGSAAGDPVGGGIAAGGSAGRGIATGGSAGSGIAAGGSSGTGGKSSGIGGEVGCGDDPSTVHGGLPCEHAGLQCTNACGTKCKCGGDLNWSCSDVATCGACPNTAPPAGTKCQGFTPGAVCQVASGSCFCNPAGDGTTEWQCLSCPNGKPTSSNACSAGGVSCTYDTTCTCYPDGTPSGGIWSCNDTPGTCPNEAPKANSPCTNVGVQCPYLQEHGSCICSALHEWKCL
jgi:hypothetical protein